MNDETFLDGYERFLDEPTKHIYNFRSQNSAEVRFTDFELANRLNLGNSVVNYVASAVFRQPISGGNYTEAYDDNFYKHEAFCILEAARQQLDPAALRDMRGYNIVFDDANPYLGGEDNAYGNLVMSIVNSGDIIYRSETDAIYDIYSAGTALQALYLKNAGPKLNEYLNNPRFAKCANYHSIYKVVMDLDPSLGLNLLSKEDFLEKFNIIKEQSVVGNIVGTVDKFGKQVVNIAEGAVKRTVVDTVDVLRDVVLDPFRAVEETVGDAIGAVKGGVRDVVDLGEDTVRAGVGLLRDVVNPLLPAKYETARSARLAMERFQWINDELNNRGDIGFFTRIYNTIETELKQLYLNRHLLKKLKAFVKSVIAKCPEQYRDVYTAQMETQFGSKGSSLFGLAEKCYNITSLTNRFRGTGTHPTTEELIKEIVKIDFIPMRVKVRANTELEIRLYRDSDGLSDDRELVSFWSPITKIGVVAYINMIKALGFSPVSTDRRQLIDQYYTARRATLYNRFSDIILSVIAPLKDDIRLEDTRVVFDDSAAFFGGDANFVGKAIESAVLASRSLMYREFPDRYNSPGYNPISPRGSPSYNPISPRASPLAKVETIFVARVYYKRANSNELALTRGVYVDVETQDPSGWWYGRNMDTNEKGWIPASYLASLSEGRSPRRSEGRSPRRSEGRSEGRSDKSSDVPQGSDPRAEHHEPPSIILRVGEEDRFSRSANVELITASQFSINPQGNVAPSIAEWVRDRFNEFTATYVYISNNFVAPPEFDLELFYRSVYKLYVAQVPAEDTKAADTKLDAFVVLFNANNDISNMFVKLIVSNLVVLDNLQDTAKFDEYRRVGMARLNSTDDLSGKTRIAHDYISALLYPYFTKADSDAVCNVIFDHINTSASKTPKQVNRTNFWSKS